MTSKKIENTNMEDILTDMFGEGGKEEVEEYYMNDINETKMKQTKENPKVVARRLKR